MARIALISRVKDKKNNTIDTCKIMSYAFVLFHGILVIPAEAGIQGKDWIPCQARNDTRGK